jgi:long-chain acyl-CoA synthetase
VHYNEALLRAKNFGSGLVALGLEANPNTFVGIYSQNCPEWVLTEQGAYCYSMVIVPLYDTLGPDACAYIIKQGKLIYKKILSKPKITRFLNWLLQRIST